MEERYSRVGILDAVSVEPKNGVSVVAGALLYDTMTQSKLIQLKFENNGTQTLTGVLVKCVLYGENCENVLGETFYQYEGLRVASGEAFGEQTPIAIQTQGVKSFDVVIVNANFEDVAKAVIGPESEQANREIAQDDSESAFVRMDVEPSRTTQMMDNAPKKKFSLKWLIAGAVLISALLIAVFGSGFGDPIVGHWHISDDISGVELHIKGKGEFVLGVKGEEPIGEGTWERYEGSLEEFDDKSLLYYTIYLKDIGNSVPVGMLAYNESHNKLALVLRDDDKAFVFTK